MDKKLQEKIGKFDHLLNKSNDLLIEIDKELKIESKNLHNNQQYYYSAYINRMLYLMRSIIRYNDKNIPYLAKLIKDDENEKMS